MILVTGATGHLGQSVITSLLNKGVDATAIAALVRDENKASELKDQGIAIRIGEYDNYESLLNALKGIDKLLLVSSSDVQADRIQQHVNVINAAKEAGVKHIAYTSVEGNDRTQTVIPFVVDVHVQTEEYLKQSGLAYTLLRNTLYADLLPAFLGNDVLTSGVHFPALEGKVPFALRTEMAEAAAEVLLGAGHEHKAYAIAADTAYSFSDIAGILSKVSGKDINYHNSDQETYIQAMGQTGLPTDVAGFFASFGAAAANGEFDTKKSDLESLLGRKPQSLEAYLGSIYSK
jgi:NAD(P)H dehydrogenase (quinone)